MTQYWVPCVYISEGVPRMVMAEMKLHAMDMVVGKRDICLEASRYSEVECWPRQAKKTPMRAEMTRVEARTRYSSHPNSAK